MKAGSIVKFPDNPAPSPVDYAAWDRGYDPPANHQLIHELTYDPEVRVAISSGTPSGQFWLVIKGEPFEESFDAGLDLVYKWLEQAQKQKKLAKVAARFLKHLSAHTARISENAGTTPPVDE